MSDVWVVFSGKADVAFMKLFKPGFRHCFALIREADRWLIVDSMLHKMDVETAHLNAAFDLPGWMRARGFRVVRAPVLPFARRILAPAPFTCVEAVKRLIGLQEWAVFTPWQLYRRLHSLSPSHFQGDHHGKPLFKA